MKVLILRILSILLKIVNKLLSEEELTKLVEDLIQKDLNGDKIIGSKGDSSRDNAFHEEKEDDTTSGSVADTSNSADSTNNINNAIQDNLNQTLPKRDVDISIGGKIL